MSLNLDPLHSVLIHDPELNFNDESVFPVFGSASQYSQRVYNALSYSDSAITWNMPPPSPAVGVSRKFYISYNVQLSFTATLPAGQQIFNQGQFAVNAYPLQQCTQSAKLNLNNSSSTLYTADIVGALLRFNTDFMTKHIDFSMAPSMLDNIGDYNFALGTNRNVFGNWGDDSYEYARGAWPINIIANPISTGTPVTATISFEACESFLISPLVFGRMQSSALIGVQTIDVQLSIGQLERFITFAGAVAPTLTNFQFLDAPKMHNTYLTPKPTMAIPEVVNYTYHTVQRYITTGVTFPSDGIIRPITSNNIQLQSVPEWLLIYARRRNSSRPNNTPDNALSMRSMSITWNNKVGLLSSASRQQLYQIAVKNGYMDSFIEWSGDPIWNAAHSAFSSGSGSYLMVGACDLGLDPGLAPGVLGTFQLNLTASFANFSGLPMDVDLFIVTITPSIWTIAANRSVSSTGCLSHADVLNAEQSPAGYTIVDRVYGGNIFSKIPWNRIGSFMKDYGLPIAQTALAVAPLLAAGDRGGLAVTGGKAMATNKIRKRLTGK